MTSNELTLPIGFSVQLTATGTFSDNSVRDLTNEVSWSSSASSVATVNATGLATAVAPGNVSFTAALNDVSGSTALTVTDQTLSGIQIRPANPRVAVGTALQLQAFAVFNDASDLDVTSQVAWSVSPAIASVSGSGLLTANASGAATISAAMSGVTGTTPLTVTASALSSLQVLPANPTLAPGGQLQLTAVGTFADGTTQNLSNVSWTSSNPGIASVDASGKVLGVTGGTSLVTAQAGTVSASTTVTVDQLARLEVKPANASVALEASIGFNAIGTFSNGKTQDLTSGVHWSSSNPGVATISQSGVGTGLQTGSTIITAQSAGVVGSTPLSVQPASVVPDPPSDDSTYFQVLIQDRIDSGHTLHFTFVASTLLLNPPTPPGPVPQNSTWLTGGGPNLDDWTQPVMQIATSQTGNSTANFVQTYDFTLSDLPLDSSGHYRVLKIPFLDPSNSAQSNAGSGRLYVTLDSPAVMQINAGGPGGFTIAQPSVADGGAGSTNRFDFVELNCATPSASNKNVCFVNTTNVDFFSLGFQIKGRQASGSLATFGLDLSGSRPVSSLISALQALPGNFGTGTRSSGGTFTRFLAPDLNFPAGATDLDTAILDGYNFYRTNTLSFTVGAVQYTATTTGPPAAPVLTFTAPTPFTIALPTTLNVIASTGPLDPGSLSADIQNGLKFVDAYLNRGVFTNTAVWNTPTAFYPAGVQSNAYAALLHQKFLNGAVYGFSFDDVPSSITTAPAIGTCTSMTLVVDEE